ncbi:MAG: discoidin domain-containing protein, partial [Verrucomicrobiota bacterium]
MRPTPSILALFLLLANGIPAQVAKEFYLQLRHSQAPLIGPFAYKSGAIIEFQGARFHIGKTGQREGRELFEVISDKTRKVYGPFVYERGREVRLGPFAFEISDPSAQIIQIVLPGARRELSLAEVEVFSGGENVALMKPYNTEPGSSSGAGPAVTGRAIDGNTNGHLNHIAHIPWSPNPWWYVDLKRPYPVDKIVIWSRTDHNLGKRLKGFELNVLDEDHKLLWTMTRKKPIETSMEIIPF